MNKKTNQPQKGFAIHCHHDILVEYCYYYEERVAYIKGNKPQHEQKIRLRLFKILPKEAEKDIPQAWVEADKAWDQKDKDAFHKKWCVLNCPWNGKELIFNLSN